MTDKSDIINKRHLIRSEAKRKRPGNNARSLLFFGNTIDQTASPVQVVFYQRYRWYSIGKRYKEKVTSICTSNKVKLTDKHRLRQKVEKLESLKNRARQHKTELDKIKGS